MGRDSTSECKDFHHPYEPYDIQVQLMQCIYDALANGQKLAILESPTGTGKTLSLICSVITWLRENKADLIAGSSIDHDDGFTDDEEDDDEPDWVNEAYKTSVLDPKLRVLKDYEEHLDRLSCKLQVEVVACSEKEKKERYDAKKKRRRVLSHEEVSLDEADFLPQPYVSDSEETLGYTNTGSARKQERSKSLLTQEVNTLLARLDPKNTGKTPDPNSLDIEFQNPVKVYFASRTHSQLTQFASQLRLPHFTSSFVEQNLPTERLKFLPLASRKQLCINPEVQKWVNVDAINDACSELLRSKNGCPFYQPSSRSYKENLLKSFRDYTFTQIHDIEDLGNLGKTLHVCPYYATRDSLSSAEIITLPYQYLLSESTRTSLGIDLKDSIVVIDEAHNLIETINSIHSAEVSLNELVSCNQGLRVYFNRFRSRLNPGNRVNLMKLMELLNTLTIFIKNHLKKPGQQIEPHDFFSSTNADTLNIHKLNKYIKASKIAYKIDSYIQSLETSTEVIGKSDSGHPGMSSRPSLLKVATFLSCLTNPAEEGRFFFERDNVLKYMLLEPSKSFQSILENSRCVILAGGTMQPISDLMNNLFTTVPEENITTFSCNHVIPDSNLETYIIQDAQFEFTFEKRQTLSLINGSLYHFFSMLVSSVPPTGGIVGFFPSYQYLDDVIDSWRRAGLFEQLNSQRKVFFEEKGGSDPLQAYSDTVFKGHGAILFAVVGGRLSEGINFQDNLCRAVVMTGLPFPNVASGELVIKTRHLENKILGSGGSQLQAKQATREFYETICMKSVNQSIGRAIRHANDYATIYLLDKRYARPEINQKLSQWVRRRLQPESCVSEIMASTLNFFASHASGANR